MKSKGIKTSEFWLSLAAVVLSFALASDMIGEGTMIMKGIGIVGGVLTSMGYTVSRAMVKRK